MKMNHSPKISSRTSVACIAILAGLGGLLFAQARTISQTQPNRSRQGDGTQIILTTTSQQVVDRVLDVLEKEKVPSSSYRFDGVRVQGGRQTKFSRGSLPMNEVVQVRRLPRTSTSGRLTSVVDPAAAVQEQATLKHFFGVTSINSIKAALSGIDSKLYRLDVIKLDPKSKTNSNNTTPQF